ncbi:xaa-Pro aminopeptidase 3-like isoform X2 [Oscarella lobularis]
MNKLSQTHPGTTGKNHVAIVPSATTQYLSQDVPYTFRQNTDFLYLTGFHNPDAILLLVSDSAKGLPDHKAVLFVQPQDSQWELWNGPRCRADDAVLIFGMDEAYSIDELPSYFRKSCDNSCSVWFDQSLQTNHLDFYELINEKLLLSNERSIKNLFSLRHHVHDVRVIKTSDEIELMTKSASIASEAFIETIRHGRSDMSELEIGAKFEYECKRRGAERVAYPPVVAAGNRANILHYLTKTGIVCDGELVLMDAGCEFHGYASDITRTWPINGAFSKLQREIYEAVLMTRDACIQLVKPGASLNAIHHSAEMIIGRALQDLGVIKKEFGDVRLRNEVSRFFPHHVGHYLGMDTHDTPQVSRNATLQPGMVVTIEPGLYFSNKLANMPDRYKGIGIRIEDDVLVTESGHKVLTERVPSDPTRLEEMLSSRPTS